MAQEKKKSPFDNVTTDTNETPNAKAALIAEEEAIAKRDTPEARSRFEAQKTADLMNSTANADINNILDRLNKDLELKALGREGVPMQSIADSKIQYNEQVGMRGAQILNKDGSTIDFGGKEAIENFAKEQKLTDFEKKTLNEFDDLAKRETERSNAKVTSPEVLVANQDKRDAEQKEGLTLDQATKDRLAEGRERDKTEAQKVIDNNAIEVQKYIPSPQGKNKDTTDNKVESDEIFTASQQDVKPLLPPDIEKQYKKVGDKYMMQNPPDTVAFEDKGNKLETKSDSNSVAESMVRIAEARGWDEIKVSGSETFRKEAWLEAASRGMSVKGYSPSEQDKAELEKRSVNKEANKVEQDNKPFRVRENEKEADKPNSQNKELAKAFADKSPAEAVKSYPELAGAAAAVAAMEKKAEADGLNPQQRAIVSARLRENVANSIERGNIPEVKIKEEIEVKREVKAEREAQR